MRNFLSQKYIFLFLSRPNCTFSKKWTLSFAWDFAIKSYKREKFRNPTYHYIFENIFKGCSVIKTTKVVFQTKRIFPPSFSNFFDFFFSQEQVCWCHNCLFCAASHLLRWISSGNRLSNTIDVRCNRTKLSA